MKYQRLNLCGITLPFAAGFLVGRIGWIVAGPLIFVGGIAVLVSYGVLDPKKNIEYPEDLP